MKHCLALLWILAFAGCGNPFSGDSNRTASYHTPNQNCQQLRLDKSTFSVGEFRDLIHCLNSDRQLRELEDFLQEIPDAQLSAASDFINLLLNQDLKTLYAVRSSYGRLKSSGLLTPVLNQVLEVNTLAPLAPAADVAADFIFDRELHCNTDSFRRTLKTASVRRLFDQHRKGATLSRSIRLVDSYLQASPEFDLQKIYKVLSRSAPDLSTDPKALTSLAAFLEAIFAQKNFSGFSQVLEQAAKRPIQCFDHSYTVFDPITIGVNQVLTSSPLAAQQLLTTEARALLMAGRGYCSVPYSAEPLFRFTDALIQHPGFDAAYRYLLPLMRHPDFIRLVSQPAARDFTLGAAFLSDHHAFQDLITLLSFNGSAPLTDRPSSVALYLDRLFADLTADQLVRMIDVIEPFFDRLDQTPLLDAEAILPAFNVQMDDALRARLRNLTAAVIRSPKLETLLPMAKRLIRENRLIPLWDQIFMLFERRIEAGKHSLALKGTPILEGARTTLQSVLLNKMSFRPAPSRCAGVNTDFAFIDPRLRGSPTWLALDRCFGGSAGDRLTLKAGKDLSDFAVTRGKLEFITQLEADVINGAFKVDRTSTLDLLSHFVDIRDSDSESVRRSLQSASTLVRLIEPNISRSPELRKILADGAEESLLYHSLVEIHRAPSKPIALRARTLTPQSEVQTWVTPEKSQTGGILQGVHALMQEYCPTLDVQNKDCDVEDDQVLLYRSDPGQLALQIIDESLQRSNSWLHPAMARAWTHSGTNQVRDFETHFHPFLHELRANPKFGDSLFNFFGGYRAKIKDLQDFISVHGRHYSLIPYVHHHPDYPGGNKREFLSRIRLKLVSDLDRLELVAINVDFKPFGIVQNIGMKFIRQIALSYGDEPADRRPPGTTAQTLASTTDDIKKLIRQLDKQALQKIGECDPRGKTRIGRWIQQSLCNGEIGDLTARVFNLKFLSQLFDQMQVREIGGNDGMRVLRDLFYSLHATNSPEQLGKFGQGVDLPAACLKAPSKAGIPTECRLDQLTLIARVTRLGLLHQAGLSAAFTPLSSVDETLRTLVEVSSNSALRQQISTWLMQPQSSQTFVSIKNWVARLPQNASSHSLHAALRTASWLKPFDWIGGIVTAIDTDPLLVEKLSDPLLLWTTAPSDQTVETTAVERSAALRAWISGRLGQVNSVANREFTNLILSIAAQPAALKSFIQQSRDIPDFNQPAVKDEMNQWLLKFASPESQSARTALKRYILSPRFDEFCDVFSDSALVDKTYNFLEKIHQNPDSDKFFTTCRAFLFR